MNGDEAEALRFVHGCARMNRELQLPLAKVRRIKQHQQTMVNWLHPADQSPLEMAIGFEQVAIEVTSAVAQNAPDAYLARVYSFGLLEDFGRLYRYSALMDCIDGRDSNTLIQSFSDIVPGRATIVEQRAPEDDLRTPYRKDKAELVTMLHALSIMAAERMTHDYCMVVGPIDHRFYRLGQGSSCKRAKKPGRRL